ncbi:hypothetical protein CASFOL_033066 [Castilleja foliolosa]|uniref:Uncharacterized protein n=1 Tax=Castilleja foliolosa TaxID=1961234 RepID=A0ABD3C5Z3_9LAMI
MDDQNASPASSSTIVAVGKNRRRHSVEEDGGDPVVCAGNTCKSCTAGVIADCVAVCCCPCGVVNILALAFLKLPWAVARKCIGGGGRRKSGRRGMLEEMRGRDGISEKGRAEDGSSEIVSSSVGAGVGEIGFGNDSFGPADNVWLELSEVRHLGFGRVSFTGVPFQDRGN